jgi:predicted O-methyltransferase YrrM
VAIVPDRERRKELRRLADEVRRGGRRPDQQLADGLEAVAARRADREARRWFERIESERDRLVASDEPLTRKKGAIQKSTIGEVARKASVSPAHAWTLWQLTRSTGARRVLEMGTCVGVSGSFLAAASGDGPGGGTLRTLEGHEDRAAVARDTFRRLGFTDAEVVVGTFTRTLPGALDDEPFDLVFIDGHHDGEATLRYVDQIRAACRPGAVLVLDDITWSDSMAAAWTEVQQRLTASAAADLGRVGVLVLGEEDAGRR